MANLFSPVTAPPQTGLNVGTVFAALTPAGLVDDRWRLGAQWLPEAAGSTEVMVPCDNPVDGVTVDRGLVDEFPLFYAGVRECEAQALVVDGLSVQVERLLDAWITPLVSSELWYGTIATAAGFSDPRFLAGGSPEYVTLPDTVSPLVALARISDALAQGGFGQGVVHVTPAVATFLHAAGVLTVRGGRVTDGLGNLVLVHPVTGGGGPNDTPGSLDTQGSWMYGTGPVQLLASPVEQSTTALDVRTNTVEVSAGKFVVVQFDSTVHVGIDVTFTP